MKAKELYELATLHKHSKGKERALCLDYYRQAAEMGHFLSQWELAEELFLFGKNCEERAEAVKWYETAATQHGYPYAKYKAGYAYYFGAGVKKDKVRGIFWFEQSLNVGESVYHLAHHYYSSKKNEEQKKALELLLQAHKRRLGYYLENDTPAELYELTAKCYENGVGTPPSLETAAIYYEKASELDSPCADLWLGKYYEREDNPRRDLKKAFAYYENASYKDSETQYLLALCYLFGKGTKKDEETGYQLLSEAAYFGETAALDFLQAQANDGDETARAILEKLNSED
ncbi:MAG: sel1 repeat family protein [Clostridia bacterium]|nr:sel1 repeat family protein [Clostridia bacterium]